jgi:hypothetical protein
MKLTQMSEQPLFFAVRRLKPSVLILITYSEPTALVFGALDDIRKYFDITDL